MDRVFLCQSCFNRRATLNLKARCSDGCACIFKICSLCVVNFRKTSISIGCVISVDPLNLDEHEAFEFER